MKVTATLEAIAQDELVGLAVHELRGAIVLVLLGGATGSSSIFSEACSAAVTIRAEGLVDGIPGKMLASTTKILSVP